MASPPRYSSTDDEIDVGPNRESTTRTARWVYVLVIVGIGLIALMIVLHLTGAVGHGLHGTH